jgi:hypothetical protein
MTGGGSSGDAREGRSKASAIELDDSNTEDESPSVMVVPPPKEASKEAKTEEQTKSSLSALLGDRAAMERERLERQKKRQRELGIGEEQEEGLTQHIPKKATINSIQESPTGRVNATTSTSDIKSTPLYWSGVIKVSDSPCWETIPHHLFIFIPNIQKSFNQFSPNVPGTPFSQFLLPTTPFHANGLTHAVIATYCVDIQWLACLFPKASAQQGPEITLICLEQNGMKEVRFTLTVILLLHNLKDNSLAQGVTKLHPDLPNWVRLVVPRRGLTEYATMHMSESCQHYHETMKVF